MGRSVCFHSIIIYIIFIITLKTLFTILTKKSLVGRPSIFIDIIIPVHNEALSIEKTLGEIAATFSGAGIGFRMIVCEDGSSDDTMSRINQLASQYPIELISSSTRKGYSKAVIDGIRSSNAEYVLCIDGDGQCDPQSLLKLVQLIGSNDVVLGWRNPRRDNWLRLFISWHFKCLYELLFGLLLKDPSYACMLMHRSVVDQLKSQPLGLLKQGLFWEMNARIDALDIGLAEVPVQHRDRSSGRTKVYSLQALPRLAFEHVVALFKLRAELYQRRAAKG